MQIKHLSGKELQVDIATVKALDGWDMQSKFIDFAASKDQAFRRAFTLSVLSYASVVIGKNTIPLTTDAMIDNHLQTWQNVEAVFEEVLMVNGIDPKTHADKPNYWDAVGAQLAVSFIAEAARLLGPAMSTLNNAIKES